MTFCLVNVPRAYTKYPTTATGLGIDYTFMVRYEDGRGNFIIEHYAEDKNTPITILRDNKQFKAIEYRFGIDTFWYKIGKP